MQPFRTTAKQEEKPEFISHFCPTHTEEAFFSMKQMRCNSELCDVVLLVGDRRIYAHRLVLAACSQYFHAMFTSELLESRQKEISLQGLQPDAMELLVEFAYTARIQVSEDNVQALLPAASLLQLESVKDACCEFLKNQLHPSNCLGIRSFADVHVCTDLHESSYRFALQHFVEVSQTEEFMLLKVNEVLDLISSNDLNVKNEEQVFNGVISWVKHDADSRRKYIARLLHHVRLCLLSRECLMMRVETEEMIKGSEECKDLLIEAMKYHLLPEKRMMLECTRSECRRPSGQVPILFAIGGGSLFAIHSECECYDPRIDRWCMITPMSTKRARVGVGVVNGCIYAVGGYDGSVDLATVEVYCPQDNQWSTVTPMGTRRSCLGVAVISGLIYAVGGYDGASCLNSIERYDPLTAQWTSVAAMSTKRRYVRVGVVGGIIYAVGGYDGSSHLNTVECFDPVTNTWKSVANMASRRSSAGVVVLNNMLYVVGGNDGASCLNTMERYNPETNTWTSLAAMSVRRSTHDIAIIESCLYAVGGNDGSSSLNSIEKYDPATNMWSTVVPMSTRRSSVGVTVAGVLVV
ncbi:predicted protein [Nematostella vectensis]|uniref:BTB domain-containing protein n=1 Tax=Nematostella vectensis TaxID=45351 RepID=A7S1L8_NEMVE|nr:kelch-like protein 17 [Nematostella vectensis]EDO42382.1 predicted protein [Nematostella vectensis]|eukprot:XP_001634445.1 predicted protein [Nematostella vectensis]